MTSLFERIGGEAAVMAAVDLFYKKVLADPLLAPFFNELDLAAQVRKQVSFMGWAFGSGQAYSGRDLAKPTRVWCASAVWATCTSTRWPTISMPRCASWA
jgi:truncated hemoglobin YjbI